MGLLRIDLKPGESVAIGNYAVVRLEKKSGQVSTLSFQADASVPITRVQPQNAAQIAAQTGIGERPNLAVVK